MFHYQSSGMRRAVAILLVFAMVFLMIPADTIAYAAESVDGSTVTTTWNFRGGQEGAYSDSAEGNTVEFNGIIIDATTGKLASRAQGDTQMNAGTKLSIPVSGSSIIVINTYPNYHNYTINNEPADADNYQYTYTGEAGYVDVVATGAVYLYEISCTTYVDATDNDTPDVTTGSAIEEDDDTPDVATGPAITDANKIDVWDFGAEQLDPTRYNNMLDVDTINGFYPGVTPGTTGVPIAGFTANNGEFMFADGGKTTSHRLRTTNTALTNYDARSLVSSNGLTTYNGFIYSNSGSTSAVYLGVNLAKNDILTVVVSSNGGNSTINVKAPNDTITKQLYTYAASTAQELTFYAPVDGMYNIYSSDEKLVVARVYREHSEAVTVSGSVNAPAELTNYQIAFTNTSTKEVITAPVTNGSYSATLNEKYSYDVTLLGAYSYVITAGSSLSIAADEMNKTFDITVEKVSLALVSGNITGLSATDIKNLKLKFNSENIFVPAITIDASGAYQLDLEIGETYTIVAEGVNDYFLSSGYTISYTENTTFDFVFEKKTTYPIKVTLNGIDAAAMDTGVITFANINEAGYAYTYNLNDPNIQLRDGQYKVIVNGTGVHQVAMGITPNCIVNGAGSTVTVNFKPINDWNFSLYNKGYQGPGIESIGGANYYLGLKLSSTGVAENKGYLLLKADGVVDIPVKAGDIVTVNYCYIAAFQFGDDASTLVDSKSGSTSKIEAATYTAAADGYVTLKSIDGTNKETYVTRIIVSTPSPYKEVITVGASNSDYTTINDALDAIRSMSRTSEQAVTVEIQPGNYEEMLVIDVPNVHLKNASSNPSTDLTNKGVDIASEAVRITSYYGHGYSYYSMGANNKYDADMLAANKANGYLAFHNPGTGTTNGSYWNATVVVFANGFEADGIIFENSYNQYISQKEANDVLVLEAGNKGARPTTAGDTSVQDRAFVERAAALAIGDNVKNVYFNNCRIVGRQDTLYGGKNSVVAFNKSKIMGAVDYIFGGMTAVFYKCDLVMNTSEVGTDVSYLTAAQQTSGRGYLMYNCTVTSTTPGVDTASTKQSKPGLFGRPWQGVTSEVVFYKTIIEATSFGDALTSMIEPAGWASSLGAESTSMYEYGTMECLEGVDNTENRVAWATNLTEAKLADGTDISTAEKAIAAFLGTWIPFTIDATDNTAVIVKPTPVQETITVELKADDVTVESYKSSFEVKGFTITALETNPVDVDLNDKTADDGTSFTRRIKLGGTGDVSARSIHFTTTGPATLKVYVMSSSSKSDRKLDVVKLDGTVIKSLDAKGASLAVGTVTLTEPGDYYLASPESGVNVYGVVLTMQGGSEPERSDWSTVVAPAITSVVQTDAKVTVTFELVTGLNGADKATVSMLDASGEVVATQLVGKNETTTTRTADFTPDASGNYTFKVVAERTDETTTKESLVSSPIAFVLPLTTPVIKAATNTGSGSVLVSWNPVKEADGYILSYKAEGSEIETEVGTVTVTSKAISGLTVGTRYYFFVKAVRGAANSSAAEISVKITEEAQRPWYFSAFGQGVSTSTNYYTGDANEGLVTVASEGGKGKLVPASTDGLAFYYTTIDADKENFILSATVTVDSWTYSNGQEGFGLMAADAVGTHGDSSAFWNNSYMNSVTKVEYSWDAQNQKVSDAGDKISMKLGIGAQEKVGVTAANIADDSIVTDIKELFKSSMTTLETSKAANGAGTYNIVGNYTNTTAPTGTDANAQTSFELTIKRDNTGYRLSYTDPAGKTTTKLYYHEDTDALTQIDVNNIYVGFFASRNAKITMTDINLTISDPAKDAPAEERPIEYNVTPSYSVISATTAAVPSYELVFVANADGLVTIKDANGKTITENQVVKANTTVKKTVTLTLGTNLYTVTFKPNKDYMVDKYHGLSSYDAKTVTHSVVYKYYNRNVIYVAPNGSSSGSGSQSSPLDIYTAVKYAKPGQTIVLEGGTYSLTSTVKIDRGISGTATSKITMVADPDSATRPVFDFNGKCAGMVIAGDFWYIQGIDVTRSQDGQKGIQVSGSNNVLDQVNTYFNGNTGIQLSRYLSSDNEMKDWPANNLILNCTSYANADKGYEDADGFAAKLTIGEGNVFDGCIAYNNADDGWDLFAKVESGPIGKVVIKNSVAYSNGYLLDGTNAGNGNGFKMGGSSIAGDHTLIDSIAFNNKAKGIDSNSGPNIQVYTSTSFNNLSNNVAFYTNDTPNTDYLADGIISYRTEAMTVNENLKAKGTQDETKIYGATNYYWDAASQSSKNTLGTAVAQDWFVSLDTSKVITRNADGTINMNGLLELTDKAPSDAGARLSGTSSADIVIPEDNTDTEVTPTPETPTAPTAAPTQAPQEDGEITVTVDASGNANWAKAIEEIKDLAKEKDTKTITVNVSKSTIIPKELFKAVQGKDTSLELNLGNGVQWTIQCKDIKGTILANINLSVLQDTKVVPQDLIQKSLGLSKDSASHQISLAHEGVFGFKAALNIDLSKAIKELYKENVDGKNLVANIFYYNPATKELTLQSSSTIVDGIASFSFTHASDYVIVFSNELIVDDQTLNEITVNAKATQYIGGTKDKKKQIEISYPDSIEEAMERDLLETKVTFTSSNKSVAMVNKKGLVTANRVGSATITTTIVMGDKTLTFDTTVTVKKAYVKFIKTSKELKVGEKATFKIAAYGYEIKDVIWMTNKKGIAAVGKNVGKSYATVYAKTEGVEAVYVKVLKSNGKYLYVKASLEVVE